MSVLHPEITVIVVTKNEADCIARCLAALADFDDVRVVDSYSADGTAEIARKCGAQVTDFQWNGQYPKKRQWCLENLPDLRDWVLWIDADEEMTPALSAEIAACDRRCAGYFVQGQHMFEGKLLRYGLRNNKLAFFNRHKVEFPVVDDLSIDGMGEIEGHYQPVLKDSGWVGVLKNALVHHAYEKGWKQRHERYAVWQAEVERRGVLPRDVSAMRRFAKAVFGMMPFRPFAAFAYSYVVKAGFLDGVAGLRFAQSRALYYQLIQKECKSLKASRALVRIVSAPR